MASLMPPVQRTLLVAKIELSVRYLGVDSDLSANEFADGAIGGQGYVHLESFANRGAIPTWRYAVADALLEARIFMAPGANTSSVGKNNSPKEPATAAACGDSTGV